MMRHPIEPPFLMIDLCATTIRLNDRYRPGSHESFNLDKKENHEQPNTQKTDRCRIPHSRGSCDVAPRPSSHQGRAMRLISAADVCIRYGMPPSTQKVWRMSGRFRKNRDYFQSGNNLLYDQSVLDEHEKLLEYVIKKGKK